MYNYIIVLKILHSMKSCETKTKSIYGQCRMRCHFFNTNFLSLADNTRKSTTRTKEFASPAAVFNKRDFFAAVFLRGTVNYSGKTYHNTRFIVAAKSIVRESESPPICVLAFNNLEKAQDAWKVAYM